MNKKIAMSAISIVSSLAIMGGATFAFFSSNATSESNIFAAGELELLVDDVDEATPSATVSGSLGGTFVPGSSQSGFISLHNGGQTDIAEIKFGANQTANNNNGDGNLADVLDLTVLTGNDNTCTTDQSNLTGTLATFVGNGFSPLTLTELNTTDYDSLPGLLIGQSRFLCVTATMQIGAGNIYQGDSITEDFVFEGHQDVSQ